MDLIFKKKKVYGYPSIHSEIIGIFVEKKKNDEYCENHHSEFAEMNYSEG